MSQPPSYTKSANFSDDESSAVSGRSTVRTAALDAELDAIETTVDATLVNLALIQRDDGALRDGVVVTHTLGADVLALLSTSGGSPRGAWLTATAYVARDVVTQGGNTYICVVAHTSGTFATDLAAVKWLQIAVGSAVGASAVAFTPTGTVAATNVQTAIAEVATEYAAADTLIRDDLADDTDEDKGAGLMGFLYSLGYATGTIGRWLKDLATSAGSTFIGWIQSGTGAVLRTLSSKARDVYHARDFGVVADGSTDDFAALQAAVNAMTWGGTLYLPKGPIKLTDEVVLHAGITLIGDGAADFIYGSPPASASVPTMLCQVTSNKACLRIGGGMHNITIKNIVFSPSVAPSYPSVGAGLTNGTAGILLTSSTAVSGTIPADNGHAWGLRFEDLTFYNLNYGIKVTDPHAGDTGAGVYPYDWSVAPVTCSNLRFIFPKQAVRMNTSNADAWVFYNCQFSVPSGGDGFALYRWGMLKLINCIAGGAVSSDRFIHVYNNGTTNGVEDIVLDACQGESLTQFICVDASVAASYNFSIVCRDCVVEITSDVYLGSPCHFVSTRNRWTCQIYVDHAGVKIDSLFDYFSGAYRFQFLKGSVGDCIQTLLPSSDATFYADTHVLNGRITRYATAAPTSEVYGLSDRIPNSVPTVGQPKAWICTTAGGAKSTTRANSTAYSANVWALWTTGTTVWEVTTAGTSAGSAPSIVGKVVDDTVADGTITWTMRSLTTAVFASEGNL